MSDRDGVADLRRLLDGMPREEAAPVSYVETTPDRERHLRTDWECSGCGERFSEYVGYGAMDRDLNVCPWCGRPIAEWIFKECQKGGADGRD